MPHQAIEELVRRDPRYDYRAYEFVFEALAYTTKTLGRPAPAEGKVEAHHHVSARELLEGIRQLALNEFGFMARVVFRMWGVNQTDDFGEIVFRLVEAKLMSKTDQDQRADFHAVYDLDEALVKAFEIHLEEAE
jgi:uncharacterized repeat protein (TIGR04138 family)